MQSRHQLQNIERRPANAVGALLAWRVVWQRSRDRLEVRVQLTTLVQEPQELKDIIGVLSH